MPSRRPLLRFALSVLAVAVAGCSGEADSGAPTDTDRALACTEASRRPPRATEGTIAQAPVASHESETTVRRPRGSYVGVDVRGNTHRAPGPTVVYLNRMGVTLKGNYDDAAHNASSVVASQGLGQATIPPAGFSDTTWNNIVNCVKDEFSRFNVQIVEQRPAAPGYHMAVFGGGGQELNLPKGVGGIAPIDKNGCQIVDQAVTFIFTKVIGGDAEENCEVAAQEISHAFSLDHEYLASDPMTYLQYNGHKTFQDVAAPCGEFSKRGCICGRPSQNSVQVLLEKLGAPGVNPNPNNGDSTAPDVAILDPADGDSIPAGTLTVTVHASDTVGVTAARLFFQDPGRSLITVCGDGKIPCTRTGDNYAFIVPDAKGKAFFIANASDKAGNTGTSKTIYITLTGNAPPPMPGKITIEVLDTNTDGFEANRVMVPRAVITTNKGTITAAEIVWTDAGGTVSTWPLCPEGSDTFALPVQIAHLAGPRSFIVQAASSNGDKGQTSVYAFTVE
ncbi:MAG: hypothetical protein EXR72_13815 [Myxococcales bacterium]|nr:hypothetical protein [Myxococcales bacterium]